MTELQKKFKKIISDLEENLKDKEDLEYVKTQIYKVYTMFLDEFDRLEESSMKKIDNVVARYAGLEDRIGELESTLDKIEKDIYVGEEEYDLDIVCPYCDAEFTIDDSEELKDKVVCPECNNVIELDWNEEHECGHDCHDCHHDCNEEDVDEDM